MSPTHRSAISIVAICFLMGLTGRGLLESFVVFLLPLGNSFGWERASAVSIYSLGILVNGLAGPFIGRFLDLAGPRAVYLAGLCLLGACFSVAAYATALWHFQLFVGFGGGIASACLGNVPNAILLGRWFRRRLTLATSIVFSALGVGIMVVLPLTQLLIDELGWRGAYRALGATALLVAVPVAILPWAHFHAGRPELMMETPVGRSANGDGWRFAEVFRNPAFWGLSAVYFFTGMAMYAITVQIVAYLVEIGFPPLKAAAAWGVSGLLLPVGMVLVGWLDGVIGRRRSVLLSYGLTILGIAHLWLLSVYPNIVVLGAFLITFGSMLGSRGPLIATIAIRVFRGGSVATILGAITACGGLGAAIGSWLGGLLHDLTGNYHAVIAFATVSTLCAITPFFTIREMKR